MGYADSNGGNISANVTADMAGVERQLEALAKSVGEITVQVNPTPINVAPAQLVAEIDLNPIYDALQDLSRAVSDLKAPDVHIRAVPGSVNVIYPEITKTFLFGYFLLLAAIVANMLLEHLP